MAITVTVQAAEQIKKKLAARAQTTAQSGLRIGVKGGGCSGLSYVIEFADAPRAHDRVIEVDGVKVYVDPKSAIYLDGTVFDFETKLLQSGFVFKNPKVKSACGCGESFTPAV